MIDDDVLSSITMIRDSARGIVTPGDLGRVRKLRYTTPGFDRSVWQTACEMGWVGLRVPEEKGGVGLGILAYCALAEELGRGLVPEPLIPAVLAAALLDGDVLEQQISGERLVLPAWQDSRGALFPEVALKIENGKVTATKHFVPLAAGADDFLVIGPNEAVLVSAKAAGVTIETKETQDGGNYATVGFESSPCTVLNVDLKPAFAEASLATSAYLLGLMEAALDMTVEYLKTRVQFGKPIGSFQILQHMAVDLKLEVELTRASVEDAALQWDRDGATAATYAAISRAKVRASQAAGKVTRDAIQLHGGIGFTDEHDIGLYLRKAIVTATQFGNVEGHLANYAALKPVREEA